MAFQRLLEDCTFLILHVFKFDFDAGGVKRIYLQQFMLYN